MVNPSQRMEQTSRLDLPLIIRGHRFHSMVDTMNSAASSGRRSVSPPSSPPWRRPRSMSTTATVVPVESPVNRGRPRRDAMASASSSRRGRLCPSSWIPSQ